MLASIDRALQDLRAGKMIIVIDDQNRENEGDLVVAADKVTPEIINFMATYGKGLICVPAEQSILDRLQFHEMVLQNTDLHQTAFTVSVDHKETTTGISAYERSLTIQRICDPKSKASDFRRPGHIFPLAAHPQGVLVRRGHTEASVDLAKLAGMQGIAVICEIMNPDGTMMRTPQILEFAQAHHMSVITIENLVTYKQSHLLRRAATAHLPTEYGQFIIYGFEHIFAGENHIALVYGDISTEEPVLSRIHSECLTGDVFGSKKCDCGPQLRQAMKEIAREGRGVILYMRQEGRGIGLINKLKAYALQEQGLDTVEANVALGFDADLRKFDLCAMMYKDLGVKSVRLMTNNPQKIQDLEEAGIIVADRVAMPVACNPYNEKYLETKKEKMHHFLEL